jgi:hypothetical protein
MVLFLIRSIQNGFIIQEIPVANVTCIRAKGTSLLS